MTMTNPNEDNLDDIFAQARAVQVTPDDDLVARVLADAAAVQAGFTPVAVNPSSGFWAGLMEAIGGWPALGGLATATVAGLWIGVAPPASVADLTASYLGDEVSVSLFATDPGFDIGEMVDG